MSASALRHRQRKLEAASGYLDLHMPKHALRELAQITDPEAIPFEFNQLRGDALREEGRFEEALIAYARALAERPEDLGVLMGMAWCYKRSNQLHRAIAAMEQAYRAHPKEAVVLYNMACYYSLGGEKTQALSWLGRALRMQAKLRKLIPEESDFDPLRNDPDFQYVTGREHLTDR
jgi:tetratricopeptide (TPR) repeat protein